MTLGILAVRHRTAPDCFLSGGLTQVKAARPVIGHNLFPMNKPTLLSSDRAQSVAISRMTEAPNAAIVSQTVLQTPELRVVLFSFADGQELTSHTSSRRALVQVLVGSCEFLFDGIWHDVAAGELIHLPPGHPHAVRASRGPFSMILTLGSEAASKGGP